MAAFRARGLGPRIAGLRFGRVSGRGARVLGWEGCIGAPSSPRVPDAPAPNCFCTSETTLNACFPSFGTRSLKLQTALSIRASFSLPARRRTRWQWRRSESNLSDAKSLDFCRGFRVLGVLIQWLLIGSEKSHMSIWVCVLSICFLKFVWVGAIFSRFWNRSLWVSGVSAPESASKLPGNAVMKASCLRCCLCCYV